MNIGVAIRTGLEPTRLIFSARHVRASLWIRDREMAELADRVYVRPNQQVRIGAAVRKVTYRAPLGLDDGVFKHEWSGYLSVAICATVILRMG